MNSSNRKSVHEIGAEEVSVVNPSIVKVKLKQWDLSFRSVIGRGMVDITIWCFY